MEVELKYSLPPELQDELWNDPELQAMEEDNSREELAMRAVYFDTEDMALQKRGMALRVRLEGERMVATLKWDGTSEGALHQRRELNMPMQGDVSLLRPDLSLFKESEIGDELFSAVGDKPLLDIMETKFLRRRFRVDSDNNLIELSLDKGAIITDMGSVPLSEAEFELFSGDEEGLRALGERFAGKYGLEPENRSKYARGLALINGAL